MAKREDQHVVLTFDEEKGTILVQTKGHPDLVCDTSKIHAKVMRRAAMVGLSQVRIVDAAAVPVARKDGSIMPLAERLALKHSRMKALIEHLESGTEEWSRHGEGGGGLSITIQAIANVKGVDYATAEAYVADFAAKKHEGDRKAALAFLRDAKAVQDEMARIRDKARKPANVDADAALADLTAPQAEGEAEQAK